jgi:hypothetical protein
MQDAGVQGHAGPAIRKHPHPLFLDRGPDVQAMGPRRLAWPPRALFSGSTKAGSAGARRRMNDS